MKSYVTLETKACPVCGQMHQSGNLLFDRRLRETFEHETCTGWELCPEHQAQLDDGFVFLVGIDEEKSDLPFTPSSVYRTGTIAAIRKEAAAQIFDIPIETLAFTDEEVITKLEELQA